MKKLSRFLAKLFLVVCLILFLVLSVAYLGAAVYKKQLLAYFNSTLNEQISGELHFNDLHFSLFHPFPSVSVGLEGFTIKDSVYKQDVLRAENVFLQIRILPLFRNEVRVRSIVIQDAVFSMQKDSSGYSNVSAFRLNFPQLKDTTHKENRSTSSLEFSLKNLSLNDVIFLFHDEKKHKTIRLTSKNLKVSLFKNEKENGGHIKGTVISDGLLFNEAKGAFLSNKQFLLNLHLHFDSERHKIELLSNSSISGDGQVFGIQGYSIIDKKPPKIILDISSKDTDYLKALSLLTPALQVKLQKFLPEGGLSNETKLVIDTKPGTQPIVVVNFHLNDSRLKLYDAQVTHAFLDGSFTNHADTALAASDTNSRVEIHNARFSYHGIQWRVQGNLSDFTALKTEITASANGPLIALNHFLDSTKSKFSTGNLDLDLTYRGPLELQKNNKEQLNASINGHIIIDNGHLDLTGKNLSISGIKGGVDFSDNDVTVNHLAASLNNNPVEINGTLQHLVPFLLFPDKKCQAQLSLYSPRFNINNFVSTKKRRQKKSKAQLSNKAHHFMQRIEKISNQLELILIVKTDQIQYKKLITTKASGVVSLDKEVLSLKDWRIGFATGGNISLNGKYFFNDVHSDRMELNATLSNLDASRLFYGFDDFNQKTISYKQLGGKISSSLSMTCEMGEDLSPVQKTLKGVMKIQLSNGTLNEFEPLKNISHILFRERDLMNIRFEEINSRFIIDGYEINIEKLNVNSSAISLFLEGTYSFKDNTDLSIQIPLSNLKARKKEFYHADEDTKANIRLRAKDKDGKVSVFLDQFNKYRKDKRLD